VCKEVKCRGSPGVRGVPRNGKRAAQPRRRSPAGIVEATSGTTGEGGARKQAEASRQQFGKGRNRSINGKCGKSRLGVCGGGFEDVRADQGRGVGGWIEKKILC